MPEIENSQSRREKLHLPSLKSGNEQQMSEQRRANLARVLNYCEAQLAVCCDPIQRKKLGAEKAGLQKQIHAIRPARRCPGAVDYFIEAAKAVLSPKQFESLVAKASERKSLADAQPNLTQARKKLVDELADLRNKIVSLEKESDLRKRLGQQIHIIHGKLHNMPSNNAHQTMERHFIETVRTEIPRSTFTLIMDKAARLKIAAASHDSQVLKFQP